MNSLLTLGVVTVLTGILISVLNLMNLLLTLGGVDDGADGDIDLRSEPNELTADVRRCR